MLIFLALAGGRKSHSNHTPDRSTPDCSHLLDRGEQRPRCVCTHGTAPRHQRGVGTPARQAVSEHAASGRTLCESDPGAGSQLPIRSVACRPDLATKGTWTLHNEMAGDEPVCCDGAVCDNHYGPLLGRVATRCPRGRAELGHTYAGVGSRVEVGT